MPPHFRAQASKTRGNGAPLSAVLGIIAVWLSVSRGSPTHPLEDQRSPLRRATPSTTETLKAPLDTNKTLSPTHTPTHIPTLFPTAVFLYNSLSPTLLPSARASWSRRPTELPSTVPTFLRDDATPMYPPSDSPTSLPATPYPTQKTPCPWAPLTFPCPQSGTPTVTPTRHPTPHPSQAPTLSPRYSAPWTPWIDDVDRAPLERSAAAGISRRRGRPPHRRCGQRSRR